ncbi:MAG TPA: hypothetical protein VFG35_05275 [Actinoplanes sp.]|nr:hypothetical protein [Actinoplanes sp.]
MSVSPVNAPVRNALTELGSTSRVRLVNMVRGSVSRQASASFRPGED